MTKKIVKPALSKNTWGLVQMDGIAKLQWELKKAEREKSMKRNLWKSDWRK